jgi:hypothetical protein
VRIIDVNNNDNNNNINTSDYGIILSSTNQITGFQKLNEVKEAITDALTKLNIKIPEYFI